MKAHSIRSIVRVATYASAAVAALALGAQSCGGKFEGDTIGGSLSDAGVFTNKDGAVIFSPGSACVNYNYEAGPAPVCTPASWRPSDYAVGAADNATCSSWDLDLNIGYPTRRFCGRWFNNPLYQPGAAQPDAATDAGACNAVFDSTASGPLQCTPGAQGDVYCSAFYQQFVLNGGVASAKCSTFWMATPGCHVDGQQPACPTVSACVPACGTWAYTLHNGSPTPPVPPGFSGLASVPVVCVQREGEAAARAETFCKLPPYQ